MHFSQRIRRAFWGQRAILEFRPTVILLSLLVAGVCCVTRVDGQARVPFPVAGDPEQTPTSSVYLPTDRALSRAMTRARERLDAGEFQQALTFLHQVLTREEDSFLDETPDSTAHTGLKATARKLIGELPPEGRDAFELLYGAAARRQLDAAAAAGDRTGVAQVVRQYFHTVAGYEGALLLAQMESDAGHYAAAGQLYQELLDAPRATAALEPQLSTLAALNQVAAGRAEQAANTLRKLVERDASAAVELAGRSTQLPGSRGDLAAWLTDKAGKPEPITFAEREWATLHGNPARNARHDGGGPHLRTRWQARVVNDPNLEEFLTNRGRQFGDRGVVVLPAARPIAVGNVVLMRTPSNIVAVDWQTGKRIWETRDEEGLSPDQLLPSTPTADNTEDWSTPAGTLEQRLWDDALSMSLSSDGERAYAIRGATVSPEEAVLAWQIPNMNGPGNNTAGSTNQLSAFELATEGKLAWELDGARTNGDLAGAFFLGAPLAVENTLYVLAEVRSAVYLVALDPRSGRMLWQQQLVELEQGIALEPRRRLAGSSPSYNNGVLVCPTAAGATVAVDVVRRELAWVYEYSRDALSKTDLQNLLQQQIQNQMVRQNDHWLDSAAIIDDGRVFLTPPESQELHCVDLRTGALVWKNRQGDSLFVGCVDKGIVLLVGSQALEAVRAVDGAPAWSEKSLALPEGTRPAGQGFLSAGRYYLPLTSGAVLAIDVVSGKQISLAAGESGTMLGNLICARGSVLSQSSLVMDKFDQIEVLERRAETALAKNSEDANAIRELAEMKRLAGRPTEAITLLKRAYGLAPNDPIVREMLVEYLLESLNSDFNANRADLPMLRRLIAGKPQELRLLRMEARALEAASDRLAAWDAYERVANLEAGKISQLEISDPYTVRSDRWLAGRLAALWSAAAANEQAAMTTRVEAAGRDLGAQASIDALQQFVGRYGALPAAEQARLQLARRLSDTRQFQAAEIELLQLERSQTKEMRAAAAALLTQGLVESGRYDVAAAASERLRGEWADVVVFDGLTGRQWMARLAHESSALTSVLGQRWPRGKVMAQNIPAPGPTLRVPAATRPDRVDRQPGYRQVRIEQDNSAAKDSDKWFISANDGLQLVGRTKAGNDFATFPLEQNTRGRAIGDATTYVHAARLGQLLIVSLGGRIMALDARQETTAEGEVLWQAFPLGRFPIVGARGRGARQPPNPAIYHDSSDRKRDRSPNAAGALGPVTPRGVVFFEQSELKCVDPTSGEMLWSRKDIPRNCELFGDEELVLAADAKGHVVHVLKMMDGELVGKQPLPETRWLLTAGRNVARTGTSTTGGASKLFVAVVDAASGKELYTADFNPKSVLTVAEPNLVAVYDPGGKFQVIDVRSGKPLVDEQLDPYANVDNIKIDVSNNELVLVISSRVQPGKHTNIGVDFAPVDGLVYAFNLNSGEPLWPAAAVVHERFMSLASPPGLPIVVFAERETQRDTGGGNAKLRLLCLDKRTGASVYRNDDLPDTAVGQFRVRVERAAADAAAGDAIAIEMSAREIRLTPTDEPRPPEPPAHDDLVATREFNTTGIPALIQGLGKALQDQQDEKLDPLRPRRGANRRGR